MLDTQTADAVMLDRGPEIRDVLESAVPRATRHTACSFVVPMFNEESAVLEFGRRVGRVLDELDGPSEVILVDDGSTDRTYTMMLTLRAGDRRFKVVRLSRNFGHQIAITAGLDLAAGDIAVIMDGDLQHPPELVHEFIRLWTEGYDVVYGVMSARQGQSLLKRVTAGCFYRVLRALTPVKAPAGAGDFRLVDRKALEAFRSLHEEHRFVRGMWDWIGFRQTGVPYVPEQRYAGTSKYTVGKMTRLALDGIMSFSAVPLRVSLALGGLLALISVAWGILEIGGLTFDPSLLPANGGLILAGAAVLSVQLLLFGLLGEYVGRIYDEVKRRPVYITDELKGFGQPILPTPGKDRRPRP